MAAETPVITRQRSSSIVSIIGGEESYDIIRAPASFPDTPIVIETTTTTSFEVQVEQFTPRFHAIAAPSAARTSNSIAIQNMDTRRGDVAPPPYVPRASFESDRDDSALPDYYAPEEPLTLAQHLFTYGFIFPLFWIIGITILFYDLSPIPEEECGKSVAEQKAELAILRETELKWARRCLFALITLLTVIGLLILGMAMAHVGAFRR